MDNDELKLITNLIQQIEDAEAPASVTNSMVARVFQFLNSRTGDLDSRLGDLSIEHDNDIAAERQDRETADAALASSLAETGESLSERIEAVKTALERLPIAEFAEIVEGALSPQSAPTRIEFIGALSSGTASVVFSKALGRFLFRIKAGSTSLYYMTWTEAAIAPWLKPSSYYVAGRLFLGTNPPRFYTWNGGGAALKRLGDYYDILTGLASVSADLVGLRTETDQLAASAEELAARVAELEEYGVGGGGDGSCGCGRITSAEIAALFGEAEPEPELPGEALTEADLDDLLDDGITQSLPDAVPGEERIDEATIDKLISLSGA